MLVVGFLIAAVVSAVFAFQVATGIAAIVAKLALIITSGIALVVWMARPSKSTTTHARS